MSVTAGIGKSYTVVPGTADVAREAATVKGEGATVVVASWGLTSDTLKTDKVNLSADLSTAVPNTSAARLTSSLAQLLKGASHVDPATGDREINQGISDTLASQVGQLLVGSGFSQADAAKASASLVQQFASASSGTSVVALSLSRQSQNVGTYTTSVAGGQEVSAYSVQSTSNLDIAFTPGSGDLSIKLDQHKVAATRIEWSSATATDVSISLTQPELEAIGFDPTGTNRNTTGSPVQETATTSSQGTESVGSSDVSGPNALSSYLDFENGWNATPPSSTRPVAGGSTTAANPAISTPSLSAKQTAAEAAVLALKKIIADARSAFVGQGQPVSASGSLSITQQIGAAVTDQSGSKSLVYTRPTGEAAVVSLPSLSVRA